MSNLVIELTDEQFKDEVEKSDEPVMVDFWASWCAPCKKMAPIIKEIADKYKGRLKIAKLNVEENQFVASRLGIMNIPTFVFFKNGKELSRISGVVSKGDLDKRIEKVIGT